MKNEYQELKRMRDDTSNSVYLREIALLSEKNDELRVTIDKLKKGGGIRGENERLKLTIERLNIQLTKYAFSDVAICRRNAEDGK